MIAAVKIDIKQQEIKKKIKSLLYKFSEGYFLSKLETQCKTDI